MKPGKASGVVVALYPVNGVKGKEPPPAEAVMVMGELPMIVKAVHEAEPEHEAVVVATD